MSVGAILLIAVPVFVGTIIAIILYGRTKKDSLISEERIGEHVGSSEERIINTVNSFEARITSKLNSIEEKIDDYRPYVDGIPKMLDIERQSLFEAAIVAIIDNKYDLAIRSFNAYLRLVTQDLELCAILNFVGIVLDIQHESKEAIQYFTKLAEVGTRLHDAEILSVAYSNSAIALSHLDQGLESLEALNRAIGLRPDWPIFWYQKGIVLNNLGRTCEALDAFNRAIDLKPDFPVAWAGKGDVLHLLGQNRESLEAYERAIRLKPDYARAWAGKGDELVLLDRPREGLEAYEEASRLQPTSSCYWCDKAALLCALGRYQEGLRAFEMAIELDPENKEARNLKQELLCDLGLTESS